MSDDIKLWTKHYAVLSQQKKALEVKLRILKDEMAELEPQILGGMDAMGVVRLATLVGTFGKRRDLSVASVNGDTSAVVDVLLKARMKDFLSPNTAKLKAFAKERCYRADVDEWVADINRLPPSLRPVLRLTEYVTMGLTKS